jgi:aminotransferase
MMQYARDIGRDESDLVYLVRGEPDSITPAHIRKALSEAVEAGYTHYPPIAGYRKLRQAVAQRIKENYVLDVDADNEVLITSGATMGMYLAIHGVLRPSDEVLLPEPIYDAYIGQLTLHGAKAVFVSTEMTDSHFHLSRNDLEAARTPYTKAIILNTPWNPTGTVMSRAELIEIAEFAVEHELYIFVDEIYHSLVYDDHVHYSLASLSDEYRERVITINSFSKTYAMTGWRLGYNLASPSITKAMLLHYQQCSRGSSAFVQQAGVAALLGPQEHINDMLVEYAERRKLVVEGLKKINGLGCLVPEGTFFCLLDARMLRISSEELAQYLVRDYGLITVPGVYYGSNLEGFLRISFSYGREEIARGLERLADGIHQLERYLP